MKPSGLVSAFVVLLLLSGCIISSHQSDKKHDTSSFEQVGIKNMITRYLQKDQPSAGTVEGIYSVSVVIIKRGKGFLSSAEKEKTVERKENFSKVAILRDGTSANREYIELSMNNEALSSFPIIGEFSTASDGNLLVYKHLEAKGKTSNYTFTYDVESDLLEGIRTENKGATTFIYKLTYLKLSPKNSQHAKF